MTIWRCFRSSLVLVCIAASSAFAAAPSQYNALAAPVPLPTDDRIVQFTYSEDAIYTVLTQVGAGTHVQLQPGEGITEKPALGDSIQWRLSGGPTNLYVKPVRPGITTTMSVVTNKRIYEFQLVSSPAGGKFYQKIYFNYPDDEQAIQLHAKEEARSFVAEKRRLNDQILSPKADPTAFHYGYSISGEAPFKPLEVLDDGKQTFIRLPSIQDQPAVFLQDEKGKLQLVDFRVRGDNFMIMDRIADRFVLKLNDQVVTVVSDRVPKHWWNSLGSSASKGQ